MTAERKHLCLQPGAHEEALWQNLYAVLVQAVGEAARSLPTGTPVSILDVGCGRGELLHALASSGFEVTGVDADPECVAAASKFSPCEHLRIDQLSQRFEAGSFDIVTCSHVLEHLDCPIEAMRALRALCAHAYVFAVPNLLRPVRILRAILGSRLGDHPEHVSAWGHAEFSAALGRAGYEIDQWYSDRVTVNPFSGAFGARATGFLWHLQTRALPKLFPMLNSSLVVRCHPGSNEPHARHLPAETDTVMMFTPQNAADRSKA